MLARWVALLTLLLVPSLAGAAEASRTATRFSAEGSGRLTERGCPAGFEECFTDAGSMSSPQFGAGKYTASWNVKHTAKGCAGGTGTVLQASGPLTITFAAGKLSLRVAGSACETTSENLKFAVTFTVSGGTGRFEDASGSGTGSAIDPGTSHAWDLQGTIDLAAEQKRTLTVSVVGEGSVRSAPSGIACQSGRCEAKFGRGERITLTATARSATKFLKWSGDACDGSTSPTCTLTLDADRALRATFVLGQSELRVQTPTGGSVRSSPAGIACPSTCRASFASRTRVTLTATPRSGYSFGGWSGACTGSSPTCTVTLEGTTTVGATFAVVRRLLKVTAANGGRVRSEPAGIDCPGACEARFANGTVVRLTATWPATVLFDGWAGACSNSTAMCSVTMTADRTVGARFRARPTYELSVRVTGQGTVSGSGIRCPGDCSERYTGGQVALSASPRSGWKLARWEGGCTGSRPKCVVTISARVTVTAVFVRA